MAAQVARSDVTVSGEAPSAPSGAPAPGTRLRAVEPTEPSASCEADLPGAVHEIARSPREVIEASNASLVRALREASATLGWLAASAPAVTTDAFEIRAVSEYGSGASVLSSIDARRAVLTKRDTDGAVASWLVDDGAIVARLPPDEDTRLDGDIVVTANQGERALFVAYGPRARHGGSVLALSLDLSRLDACSRRPAPRFGRRRAGGSSRLQRHDLGIGRTAPVTRRPRSAGPISRGHADDVVVPPGMSARDAALLDGVRRAFARERGTVADLSDRTLVDVRTFLAAASARFLEGREGAIRVLDASPVLYGVLVRYHGVSYVT